MVLDLKILMYHNTDEIGKLQKIKADSDKEILEALQQVKNLSDSNTALQQELDELKVAAQAVVDMVDIPRGQCGGTSLHAREASESSPRRNVVHLGDHPIVHIPCTRVGEVLLATHDPRSAWRGHEIRLQ